MCAAVRGGKFQVGRLTGTTPSPLWMPVLPSPGLSQGRVKSRRCGSHQQSESGRPVSCLVRTMHRQLAALQLQGKADLRRNNHSLSFLFGRSDKRRKKEPRPDKPGRLFSFGDALMTLCYVRHSAEDVTRVRNNTSGSGCDNGSVELARRVSSNKQRSDLRRKPEN